MFCNRNGGPLWPRSITDDWYTLKEQASPPEAVTLHQFRHTLSSLLDDLGASESVKQRILGHGPKNVTQRYTYASIETMRRYLDEIAVLVT